MKSFAPPAPLLTGAPNFRDLGGYTTSDGRRVRKGLLYRSEGLSSLTTDDLLILNQLDISLICDLRSSHERHELPTRWCSTSTETLNMDVSVDLRAGNNDMLRSIREDPSESGARAAMLMSYRRFPTVFSEALAILFERILTDTQARLLFHCTAGKDRTGFVSAMLLAALDVEIPDIFEDYLLTNHYWTGSRTEAPMHSALADILETPASPGVLRALSIAKTEYLGAAFKSINENYGDVLSYLEAIAGLNAQTREKLKAYLLE
ncbi:protein-tyrosine phosphatase [Marinobacter sp. es.048]|uniref:tyrosine-protein phosphatase n=1 Tax=Marinobacter sp. es.048 TaxID=1761795 RepID=UPI000B58855C|nr:tyrosine-protein phosphatase [Marinobacter sp. es.048]SNC62768.1 protein-tyrosine phosphatase [Marinobacter sp. es.048]